jgi:hypothetical protein
MLFPPEAPGPAGPKHRDKRERNNAQVDCRRLCSDLGVISTGFATRIPPSARPTGRSSPRSMRRRYAHGEWCLRENSRPPCRQQVRPRAHLLKPRTQTGRRYRYSAMDLRAGIKNAGPRSRDWHLSDLGKDVRLEPAQSDPKRTSLRPTHLSRFMSARSVVRTKAKVMRVPMLFEVGGVFGNSQRDEAFQRRACCFMLLLLGAEHVIPQ